jgi:hypothetical protein
LTHRPAATSASLHTEQAGLKSPKLALTWQALKTLSSRGAMQLSEQLYEALKQNLFVLQRIEFRQLQEVIVSSKNLNEALHEC